MTTPPTPAAPGCPARLEQLKHNLDTVTARLRAAEKAAGRPAGSVLLLPVTKFHDQQDLAMLASLGVKAVGENRVAEAAAKHELVPEIDIHLIGGIQTKKANAAARFAHKVHSVDSEKIARALDKGTALAIDRGQRAVDNLLQVFIQFSFDGDPRRGGTGAVGVARLAELVDTELDHLELAGVMCMAPVDADPGQVVATARELTDRLAHARGRQLLLSAGMSGDMEQAVAHGSDLVRVGTAIMGTRPLN